MKYIITEHKLERVVSKYIDYLIETSDKTGSTEITLDEINRLWVNYQLWDKVAEMFSLNEEETRAAFKKWGEKYFETDLVRPFRKRW